MIYLRSLKIISRFFFTIRPTNRLTEVMLFKLFCASHLVFIFVCCFFIYKKTNVSLWLFKEFITCWYQMLVSGFTFSSCILYAVSLVTISRCYHLVRCHFVFVDNAVQYFSSHCCTHHVKCVLAPIQKQIICFTFWCVLGGTRIKNFQ